MPQPESKHVTTHANTMANANGLVLAMRRSLKTAMRDPVLSEEEDYSVWEYGNLDDEASLVDALVPVELVVDGRASGLRLDKWLSSELAQFSRTRLQQWIEVGLVLVNGQTASVRRSVWEGDRVRVTPKASGLESAFQPEPMALPIVFEDAFVLVVNKPAGLVVHPGAGNWSGTLLNGLLHHHPALATLPRAGIVHRLDKDTTGLMVVAKTLEAQTDLVRQLQARAVKREYLALVHGAPPDSGTLAAPIGRNLRDRKRMAAFKESTPNTKAAVTHFQLVARGDPAGLLGPVSLVCCALQTGRTHQIRVHMQWAGYPLVGDPQYGAPGRSDPFERQALHAWKLGFVHPETARAIGFCVPVPDDFEALLQKVGLLAPASTEDRDAS